MTDNNKNSKWDCIIYIYAPRSDTKFWMDNKSELESLNKICKFIEYPNRKVTENLFMLQPYLIEHKYKYVFVLLDDCKLVNNNNEKFPLDKFLKIMNHNNLTVASPLVS